MLRTRFWQFAMLQFAAPPTPLSTAGGQPPLLPPNPPHNSRLERRPSPPTKQSWQPRKTNPSNVYESMLFLFVEHAYDVGDLLEVDGVPWRVKQVGAAGAAGPRGQGGEAGGGWARAGAAGFGGARFAPGRVCRLRVLTQMTDTPVDHPNHPCRTARRQTQASVYV